MNELRFNRVYLLVLALATLSLVSSACGGSATPQLVSTASAPTSVLSSGNKPTPTVVVEQPAQAPPTDTPTPAGPQIFKIGDTVKIGDSVLIVLGWSESRGNDFSKPDAGSKFVNADVLIVNAGDSAASISSFLQVSLKDGTGQKYETDLTATVAADKDGIDGELAPGERVRGTVAFQVPEEAKGLQFVFDAEMFGMGKVFVEFGDTPVANEPPTKVEGETEQKTFSVGETVEIGAFAITINEVSSPMGDSFNRPDPETKFVVVDVTVINRGSKAENVSSALQMWLKDPTGQRYKVDLSASIASGGTTPDGEITASEKLRGQVGYQVPENVTGLVFVFDAELFGEGKVLVALP